jgi:cation diffusion facilitator CzcD-associated flavoprotein CzcO
MSTRPLHRDLSIGIVGAGFGGLAAAIEFKRNGFNSFTVFERQHDVGGVWRANTYPGAACDLPSDIYTFSFAFKTDWLRRYGTQPEIQQYLAGVADQYGLSEHLRLGTTVESATWDATNCVWKLHLAGDEELQFDVIVCATGQLSRPKIPDLPGQTDFLGPQFHSAQWDHGLNLDGQHVAVVGSGASAVQIVPAIADRAAKVTLIQRSPNWIMPKRDWATTKLERLVMALPGAVQLRYFLSWWKFESNVPLIYRRCDPLRSLVQARLRRMIRRIVVDDELAKALTPTYPIGCNRTLISSEWYPTLARDDVHVIPSAVKGLTRDSLITAEGSHVETDVIVWCTGFTPTEYIAPMRVTGVDGVELRDHWRDGPEAFLGMVTPGFPNMFMSYGPNAGSLTNTITYLLERQARYMRQAVAYLVRSGVAWVDVRHDVHDVFNRRIQDKLQKTVFTAGCPGWYTTDSGKVTQVWPGSHVAYTLATRKFDPNAYRQGNRVPV